MKSMAQLPRVIVWGSRPGEFWQLERPLWVVEATELAAVQQCLETAAAAATEGCYVAGFVAYEAAPAFDPAFCTRAPRDLPLAWFGVFGDRHCVNIASLDQAGAFQLGEWTPSISRAAYAAAIERIKTCLLRGETYQVNFTFRLYADFQGDPLGMFVRLHRNQWAAYCALIETEQFAICSASPELFFELDGKRLVSKPMKGTAARGLTWEEDQRAALALSRSEKDRAENVMIVDMVRNDMGRIAEWGTVTVEKLCEVERYPTVLQMTSTVACRTAATMPEIMRALFPCASITGAPKVRTMTIIRDVEQEPRGIYTGAVGLGTAERRWQFNVAIRTVTIHKKQGRAQYGVGGGVVWDSTAGNEYEECLTKSRVLTADLPDFDLLESVLWDGANGYWLLDFHLERLAQSAAYFGFRVDLEQVPRALLAEGARLGSGRFKVRLRVSRGGEYRIEAEPLAPGEPVWRVALSQVPVQSSNPFLYHKTTYRKVYEEVRRSAGNCDDVVLWNERGEVTESTTANVVVELDGKRLTPPVRSGLLPGVFRRWLLEQGEIEEGIIRTADLKRVQRLFLINSVRGWIPVRIV
ncbi:MAG: aminodeoxychorismate synthase component I [Kiritimatiellia bacterium]